MKTSIPALVALRKKFHANLISERVLSLSKNVASNADSSNRRSKVIALSIAEALGAKEYEEKLKGQTLGQQFERHSAEFLDQAFALFSNIRPGAWAISQLSASSTHLHGFEQFSHLGDLAAIAREKPELAAALGNDYLIAPDVVILRYPEDDSMLDPSASILSDQVATRSSLRKRFQEKPILHASISCKWTVRSDRAQNSRAEALNLLRNRKGRAPHIVVILGEPTPSRIASIALGTGDIDCVYHFALPELQAAISDLGFGDAEDMLAMMVEGNRLKDISDLPLDLAV